MRRAIVVSLMLSVSAGAVLAQTGSPPSPSAPAVPKAAAPAKPTSPSPATASAADKQAAQKTAKDNVAECMRLWDAATHMTKQEWARTCERIQSRLENLRIENLDFMGTGVRKGPKRQGSFNAQGVWNGA
jgi:hypothetical protein